MKSTSRDFWDRLLTLMLVLAVVGSLGTLIYVVSGIPQRSAKEFTEFYVVNAGGKSDSYPSGLVAGQTETVTLGIVNQEQQRVTYKLDVIVQGESIQEIPGIILEHGERWQREVSFTFASAGPRQKIEFLLYKSPGVSSYRSLYLTVDVV